MMRVICLLLFSIFALKVNAQQYTKFNGYGFAADRMRSDSISIHPSDTVRNKAARSIAVLNGVFYIADGTKWKVVGTDTTSLSNRINLKLNIADTSAMLNPYLRKTDTVTLSNRINTKLNIADTSAMLNPYLRKVDTATLSNRINLKLNIADTVNKWVTNVYKVNDSTIAVLKNGITSNIVLNPAATKLVTSVYNNTGSTITKGSVVYISGRHSSNLPTIALAIGNNEENSYKTFALVQDDILPSNSGVVIQAGKIENLNLPTSQFTDGDIVYLSPTVPGGITITKPLAPFHICKIGSVTRAHPTFGSIEIKIENGWQLDELSDVQIAAVPLDSTILQFSRVDSLWHDVNPTTAMGNRFIKPTDTATMLSPYYRTATATSALATKLNISDTATMLNPYTRGSGTSGQVAYWNGTRSLTGSSGFTFTPTSSLLVNNSVTAASAIARGTNLTPTLVAAANNDVLVGLDINPTFTNGAFTGVTNIGARIQGNTVIGATSITNMMYGEVPRLFVNGGTHLIGAVQIGSSRIYFAGNNISWENTGIANNSPDWRADATGIKFGNYLSLPLRISIGGTENVRFFSTGNSSFGTTTDAGFRLDVNGTARVQGTTTITGSTTATGAIARGANLTPTLVAAANNDVLVGLDINPTFTNGAFTGVSNLAARFNNGGVNFVRSSNVSFLGFNSGLYGSLDNYFDLTYPISGGIRFLSGTSSGFDGAVFQGFGGTQGALAGQMYFDYGSMARNITTRIATWRSMTTGLTSTVMTLFADGNMLLQNGGTHTNAGFRLDVNGTARVQGALTLSGYTPNYVAINGGFFRFISMNTPNANGLRIDTYNGTDFNRPFYFRSDIGVAIESTSFLIGANSSMSFSSEMNASAIFQINSSSKGFLPPRMTTAQRDLIATPAAGLVIYNTTLNQLSYYNGTTWINL